MVKFTIESAKSLKNFRTSGTIFPCSKSSAKFALKKLNLTNANLIVELGCGTGVFTKEILKKKEKNTKFFGIEINENLAKETKKRFPEAIIYNDSAENLSKYFKDKHQKKADCIISTLPWAIFKEPLQKKILNEIYDSLSKNGEFITISYIVSNKSKRGRKFHEMLKEKFTNVKKTRPVIKNLPPAFFYLCKK